ncbi:MAG: type II secretion system protein GspD, partial [Rhizobiales bacterium]|nr:type II secretion system protein GspD [Hyphomicrobiales bacterium]
MPIIGGFVRLCRSVRMGPLGILVMVAGTTLAGCNYLIPDNAQNRSPNIIDQTQSIDLLPRFPQPSEPVTANRAKDPRSAVYNGAAEQAENTPAVTLQGAEPSASGDGFDLNFENAPVTTVAKVILGDILGTGYIIDPRVQGTVTLTSGRPVPKSEVLYVLESALRVSNVALIRDANGYRLVPGNEAVASGRLDVATANGRPQAGYGVSVVPVRFVAAPTLIKLLDNFAVKQGTLRVDTARNMIIVQGTGPERRSAIETVLNFDTDWMRGQTVGVFPVRHSTPEALITEVEKIMDSGEGGLSQNLVKMQPIARQNAILVVTSKPSLLKTAQNWIRRLDNSEISSTGVKVYRIRYGDARYIAKILNDMFGAGGASGGSIDSASSQIAPEAGLTTTSSGAGGSTAITPAERLTGGPALSRQANADNQTPSGGSRALSGARGAAGAASLLPNIRITADVTNNSLLIYANEENYRIIEGALRQIDRPQLQVAFDATIAEVSLNDSLTYGVQFFLKSSNVGAPPDTGSAINTIGTSAILG